MWFPTADYGTDWTAYPAIVPLPASHAAELVVSTNRGPVVTFRLERNYRAIRRAVGRDGRTVILMVGQNHLLCGKLGRRSGSDNRQR